MDNLESKITEPGFFKHVFHFDEKTKSELLNICQYSVISILPVVLLNKAMQKYVPEADDEKASLELSVEVLLQIIIMFLGIFLVNRITTYFPTYSGTKYEELHITDIVLIGLVILGSLQTKLGEKISILFDRLLELWNGKEENKRPIKNGNVKVSQPISGQMTIPNPPNMANQNIGSPNTTSINQLPTEMISQNTPDMNNSFRNDYSQNEGGQSMMDGGNIMAANEAVGGSFGANF